MRGYLWGAVAVASTVALTAGIAFGTAGILQRVLRGTRRIHTVPVMAMTLLALFDTAFGMAFLLLHGLCHPHPVARIGVLLVLLFLAGLYAVASCQVFLGQAEEAAGGMQRRRAFRLWMLWMILTLSELTFFSLFSLGFVP